MGRTNLDNSRPGDSDEAENKTPKQRLDEKFNEVSASVSSMLEEEQKRTTREFKKLRPKKKPYGQELVREFTTNRQKDRFDELFVIKRKQIQARMDAIRGADASVEGKIRGFDKLSEKAYEEIKTLAENEIAFLQRMSEEEASLTVDALGKIEVYSKKFMDMALEDKGRLKEIYWEVVSSSGGPTKQMKEVFKEYLIDGAGEQQGIAFFTLSTATQETRAAITKYLLEEYPEKGIALIEEGNSRGCYSPAEMKEYLDFMLENAPDDEAEMSVKRALENFDDPGMTKAYQINYDVSRELSQNLAKNFSTRDASNPALKMITFGGFARLIGYAAAISTIAANTLANREVIMKNPMRAIANPYVLAALGLGGGLWLSGEGKKITDIAKDKPTKDAEERRENLAEMRDEFRGEFGWQGLFEQDFEDGKEEGRVTEVFHEYITSLGGRSATVKSFESFLLEKEYTQMHEYFTEEILARNGEENTSKTLEKIAKLFTDLNIHNRETYKLAKDEMNQTLS